MTGDPRPIGEDDIEAFIDGRLTPERMSVFAAWLDAEAEVRARVETDYRLKMELRSRLSPIASQPIPARLRIATIQARSRAIARKKFVTAAACFLLVAFGAGVGWEARGLSVPSPAVPNRSSEASDAIAAHRVFVVETAHPVEVAAAQQAHLVQWLSRRVGHPLKTPDLTGEGYQLMGGRVLPAGEEAAAQFMYQDGSGGRLTVYIRAMPGPDTAFAFAKAEGFSAFSWVDGGLGFAMVATIDRPALLRLADATYRQLELMPR